MPSKAGKPAKIAHRHKLLFGVAGAVGLVLFGAIGGLVVLLSGVMSTAATKQHFAITHRLLDLGLKLSVNNAAKDIDTPPLNDPVTIALGAVCFRSHCEQCHGAPGVAPAAAAQGMLPIATGLAAASNDWSAAEIYYITKKGIRMTGMPAWEFRISEAGLWSTVAFVGALPSVSAEQYRLLQTPSTRCPVNTVSPPATSRERGDVLFRQYACHSCHRIEGVVGPDVRVGPALVDWAEQKYIAGVLPNTHENLVRWITNPQAVSRHSLMPDLNVARAHAAEMATYLLTPQ